MTGKTKFTAPAFGLDWLGTLGNDLFLGTWYADTARGSSGSDTLFMRGGNDTAYGGADHDTIYAQEGDDLSYGGRGRDVIYSGSGDDDSYGGRGDDEVYGGTGGDDLFGGNGSDELYGGLGNDDLVGGNQSDELFGGDGNDELFGGNGNDDMNGGAGADDHYGGAGYDTIDFLDSDAGINVNLLTGVGSGGDAQGDTYDGIEAVAGSNHADVITGDHGDNSLYGFGDNDVIIGHWGDDVINGGANGAGAYGDILTGGHGADTFRFGFGSGSQSGGTVAHDVITDFVVGQDIIDVAVPWGVTFSGQQNGYVAPGNPMGPSAEVYYNHSFDATYGAVTHVHMRLDNNYEDDFAVLLVGHMALTESDFAFI